MKFKSKLFAFATVFAMSFAASAQEFVIDHEEFDPSSPDAEELLEQFTAAYEEHTGETAWLDVVNFKNPGRCVDRGCGLFLDVNKATQRAVLYLNGNYEAEYKVSTARPGKITPNFRGRFDGRVFNKYSSTRYPGGDWNGLGNMPYAMFYNGPYAVHGTPEKNWQYLGTPASAGCVRVHPNNARVINMNLRAVGVQNSWIQIR
jgi:hypothetical protein